MQNLFEFVNQNAESMQSYEMEKNIFQLALKIALSGMKYYFAQKGTGDIGPELKLDNDVILKRESRLHGRDYFSIFGKFRGSANLLSVRRLLWNNAAGCPG